jgi:hypothetical protein
VIALHPDEPDRKNRSARRRIANSPKEVMGLASGRAWALKSNDHPARIHAENWRADL